MDVGRVTEGRTLGGGHSERIRHLDLFEGFRYEPATLSDGTGPEKPYYCYDAEVFVLRGPCRFDPVAAALEPEGLVPVRNRAGQAVASLWLNRLKDSVIGPYHEIVVAFDADRAPRNEGSSGPYGLLYPFFGAGVVQYLHTLYISSALSIRWGREMQAFPKHPRPAVIDLEARPGGLEFGCRWGDSMLLEGRLGVRWGPVPFLKQAVGLVTSLGVAPVLRFLLSRVVEVPIVMPGATRRQYGVPCAHRGHILKGLDPGAVRSWPWGNGDRLALGTGLQAEAEPQRESATDLLAQAGFEPEVVVHVPSLQMVVTDGERID